MAIIEMLGHPALWLVLGGLVMGVLHDAPRKAVSLALPLLAFVLAWLLPEGVFGGFAFLDYSLEVLRVDRLGRLFAMVFSLALFAGSIYALRQPSKLEVPAAFVYAGAAVGAVLAGDLVTLFVCWELMAIASTLVIWAGGRKAYPAAMRYLMVHLFGGVLLMAGIVAHIAGGGGIRFDAMSLDGAAHWFMLAGFLVNAGAFPLWSWLPDAYPRASWSGMVFLSAFTTKTAVYAVMRGFPGAEVLIPIGLLMAAYGLIYALVENNARRVLAYAIINQVGFMVAGIGIGSEVALNGVAAHAFAHIVYKALLIMAVGVVVVQTGKSRCSELGGLARQMPLTTAFAVFGVLAMSAPLTAGFITKSLVLQGAADAHLAVTWASMMVVASGVFLVGLKVVGFVYFGKARDETLKVDEATPSQRAAMGVLVLMSLAAGIYPPLLYDLLPFATDYQPYTGAHVVHQLQLLLATMAAFIVLRPVLLRILGRLHDIDSLYRGDRELRLRRAAGAISDALVAFGRRLAQSALGFNAGLKRYYGSQSVLARTWPSGSMVLWVAVLLLTYLLLFYVPL